MTQKAEKVDRKTANSLDKILGKAFKVLDDGFVRVVDYMGTDESIVQAARVSYGKGTKTKATDRQLIRYLMRHFHTSPFEMCEIKLHVRVPMDCWRQWIRHRTASVNEYSTRYSLAIDSAYGIKPSEWRVQATNNKQGSDGFLDKTLGAELTKAEKELHSQAKAEYDRRIELGIAREQARKDLPLATYTEAYWKIDLHNLLHFLRLRMETNAQWEIREFANTIGNEIVKRWVPATWEAFMDYWMNSISFSASEQAVTQLLLKNKNKKAIERAVETGFLSQDGKTVKLTLEGREFAAKAKGLGLTLPW